MPHHGGVVREGWRTAAWGAAALAVVAGTVAAGVRWGWWIELADDSVNRPWDWVERVAWITGALSLPATVVFGLMALRVARPASASSSAGREGRRRLAAVNVVRIGDCPAEWLGVHSSVRQPGTGSGAADDLPRYVVRDYDAVLRERLRAGARAGGFILLVGGSAAGKTRSMYEGLRAELPSWRVMFADSVDSLRCDVPGRTVVWLEDVESYLVGLSGRSLQREDLLWLLNRRRRPVIVAGGIWPEQFAQLTALPSGDPADGELDDDPHREAREVLALAGGPIVVPEVFSDEERYRADQVARVDQRLEQALADPDFGVTQVLAGAPQLITQWNTADCYTRALINAGVDLRRIGVRAPLTDAILKEAATGYLSDTQRAEAGVSWYDTALTIARRRHNGATSMVLAVPGEGVGVLRGYRIADYLLRYGLAQRRMQPVPGPLWASLSRAQLDGSDAAQLGRAAYERALYRVAEGFLRIGAAAGDDGAKRQLARLLARQSRIAELERMSETGDKYAVEQLIQVWSRQEDVEALRRWSTRDEGARRELVETLLRLDHDEAAGELRALAAEGDSDAEQGLIRMLADQHAIDELRELDRRGVPCAKVHLAGAMAEAGEVAEAVSMLTRMAAAGDDTARWHLACLWLDTGDVDKAVEQLTYLTGREVAGHDDVRRQLIALLAEHARAEDLARIVRQTQDTHAMDALVRVYANQGRYEDALQVLGSLIAAGDLNARRRSAELLASHGRLDKALKQLRDMAAAGDKYAKARLVSMLARHRRVEDLRAMAGAGDWDAHRRLADIYARSGDTHGALGEFRALAAAGDWESRRRVAELTAAHGDLEAATNDLRMMTLAGDDEARRRLLRLLRDAGFEDEADQIDQLGLEVDGGTARP